MNVIARLLLLEVGSSLYFLPFLPSLFFPIIAYKAKLYKLLSCTSSTRCRPEIEHIVAPDENLS